jgi:ribosomal protein L40E
MQTPHRKVPNRLRELRQRVQEIVRAEFGERVICSQCGATLATYADKCSVDLDVRCPGFNAVDLVQCRAEKEVGLV